MTTVLREEELQAVVHQILGTPAKLAGWQAEKVAYESGSPATGGLFRICGSTDDGQTFSVFVKLLQHVRHWPRLHLLPPDARETFAGFFPWRQELAAWEESFAGRLPAGLRVPVLYQVTDLGDDRLLVWMEDVDALADAWDVTRFARAAYALGGLAALRGTPQLLAASGRPPGWGLRTYVDNRVNRWALPMLANDDLWRHPVVMDTVEQALRADLRRIAGALPAILDRLDALPQAVPHGDASPQNLLVPAAAPNEFVAIDISFQGRLAVGFDLGQLLVGLVHAGQMPAADLPAVHDVLVPSFAAGMKDHGADVSPEDIAYGYAGSLVVRAGLTSLPMELLDAPSSAQLTETFRERAALTRFIADLGLALITD